MLIRQIIKLHQDAGKHFFDEASMRFFNSRISSKTSGRHFVTSEKGPDNVRRYTVRAIETDGNINDIGGFQAYNNLRSAHIAMKEANDREPVS